MSETALAVAATVRERRRTAEATILGALDRIAAARALNCFITLRAEAALAEARALDARIAAGDDPGPLAGVPFGVKSLYDVAGLVTLAGSRILADGPPARADATVVARLRRAGAILVGTQNMDEFACGFTTENAHYGATRNPHDPARVAGGSSGGSAAAVAAGLVPFSLGSDTNGSIRVPAAYCGVFGLKPTFGRLPRTGTFPFVHDLDHVGPIAATVADLALAYDTMQGADSADPSCVQRQADPAMPGLQTGDRPRMAVLGGWFQAGASSDALAALAHIADGLGGGPTVELPDAERARAAAFCLTAAQGGALHLPRLRAHPALLDPAMRDRMLAGALLPGSVVVQAQRLRRQFRDRAAALFERFDVLLAPATPTVAPLIGHTTMMVDGKEVSARAHIGIYTQPVSFIGLPVVTVPVHAAGGLPLGVQIIAAPWREAVALRAAARLERDGVSQAHPSPLLI